MALEGRARPRLIWLAALMLSAAGGQNVDARFDKTGDGIVDAADWREMSEAERRAYAWAALAALGEDPYTRIEGETTRGDRFLAGLRAVYER
ncbi:MAG: hypothetical protein R8K47_05280 [Mariprofundaceae bacterium]